MSTSALPPSRPFPPPPYPPAPIQKNNPFGNVRYRFIPDCRCPRQAVAVLISLFLPSPASSQPHQPGSLITRLVLSSSASLSSPGCFRLYCSPTPSLSNRLFYTPYFLAVAVVTSLTLGSFSFLSDLLRQAFRSSPASFFSSPYLSLCYCLSRCTLCSHCAVKPYHGCLDP